MTLDDLRRALRPLSVKVANLIGHGVIKRVDDDKQIQELQVELLEGETRDEVERFQQYGLSSNPPRESDCLVVFVGGRRDQGYCLAAEKRGTRVINLQEGEVALYNETGAKIVMKANGDIEIVPKPGQKVTVSADVEVTGTLTASVDVVTNGKSLKTHTHPLPAGSVSTAPGAVTFLPTPNTGAPS